MCVECVVADEYTQQIYTNKIEEALLDGVAFWEYLAVDGNEITHCPPFTSGGLRLYSHDERPESNLIVTVEGIKVRK